MTPALLATLSVGCGVAVANLYFNQPLLELLATTFRAKVAAVAAISVATQIGYASGLLFLGPLGDRLPRKALILWLSAGLAASSQSLVQLVGASFMVGLFATLAQQIVPMAAHLAADSNRGRVVGTVMSGLLFGILGGRFFAGFVGEALGWRMVFGASAGLTSVLALVLAVRLPRVAATSEKSYGGLLASVFVLARRHATLRAAALTGALLFAAFSVFWVGLTPLLASPTFGLGGRVAGLFGLSGVAGALVAPMAGRWTDRQGSDRILMSSVGVVLVAFGVFALSARSLLGLAIGAVLLDTGIQAALLGNQARIFALDAEARSRINAFFMTAYFLGGACGSLVAGLAWARFGWLGDVSAGLGFAVAAGIAHFAFARSARFPAPVVKG
jgi:predicted MFS family arabinose efflux permease